MYMSHLETIRFDKNHFFDNLKLLETTIAMDAPPMSLAFLLDRSRRSEFETTTEMDAAIRLEKGTAQLFSRELLLGVETIKGCGLGFTPSGDDFLCGVLIGINVAEYVLGRDLSSIKEAIYQTAIGRNILSNAFLACAKDGRLFEHFHDLADSISCDDPQKVITSAQRVISTGKTSGADQAVGFVTLFKRNPTWLSQASLKPSYEQSSDTSVDFSLS